MNGEEEGFISLKFIRNLGFLRTKDTDSVLMYTIRSKQLQFIHSGDYTQYNPEDPDHAYREHAYGYWHRRGINKEEKAKVVAAVWGTELINFLAALAATIFAFSSYLSFFFSYWLRYLFFTSFWFMRKCNTVCMYTEQ